MIPALHAPTGAVPPPSYQRAMQKQLVAWHVTTPGLVTTLHLLDLSRLAMWLARRRCPSRLPKGR